MSAPHIGHRKGSETPGAGEQEAFPRPDDRPLAIALMGPTASGKTAIALDWAVRFGCHVISVDSALVYRRLDIGSAKPSAEERALAPHHLIDIRDPHDAYSAAAFRADAESAMRTCTAAGCLPLLVGGTGLYFQALLEGLSEMPDADAANRALIESRARDQGWAALHAELARLDPVAASRIHVNDPQRIQRALDVWMQTGRRISELQSRSARRAFPWRVLRLVVAPRDRALLHRRIAQRFEQMLAQGLIDEVKALRTDPRLHPDLPAVRAVGYRQAWEFLERGESLAWLRERGVAATRQLAKRQLTWLRAQPELRWLDPDTSRPELDRAVLQFLGRH